MLDFLFAVGQLLCVVGLLYGCVMSIVHRDCVDSLRAHYDPIIGHDWLKIVPVSNKIEEQHRAEAHADRAHLSGSIVS